MNKIYQISAGGIVLMSTILSSTTEAGVIPKDALTIANSVLALKVNGHPRAIVVISKNDVKHVTYTISPALPSGTQISPADCGDMKGEDKCVLTISPGPFPSALPGTVAQPSLITISGENGNKVMAEISVLTYGSLYQQGYVFALYDDLNKYPSVRSIGGTIASLQNNHPSIAWGNGTFIHTKATSLSNGWENTRLIKIAQGDSQYAASICAHYQIDKHGNSPCKESVCYSEWYVPSVCQLGSVNKGIGCLGMPTQPNMEENLFRLNPSIGSLAGYHWSSTEYENDPLKTAWIQFFDGNHSAERFIVSKESISAIRCVRDIV